MIKFDFSTYMNYQPNINMDQKKAIIDQFNQDKMNGFYTNIISNDEVTRIKEVATKIKTTKDIFIVIGIGGSFMGSYALSNIFSKKLTKSHPEVIYLGTDLSTGYLKEVIDYIKDKEVAINVISKSGTTLETSLIYKLLKQELLKKYSQQELNSRIIVTTDKTEGNLRQEAIMNNLESFDIPTDMGGRYSLISAAHLLPLAVMGLDIDNFIEGYKLGLTKLDEAYYYANLRVLLFNNKKYIENFSIYEPSLYYYTEWLKQLFSESEGKNGKGIFPISTVNTRDLHSLGQFIQEGNNIIFETVIDVNSDDIVKVGDVSLNKVNHIVTESVMKAHLKSNTPSILITLDQLNIKNIGELSAFFMLSAAFSAYLFGVNPFDQPGVEIYKQEIKQEFKY